MTDERDTPTLDELLAMDAGRELDAEIARLLGWTDIREVEEWDRCSELYEMQLQGCPNEDEDDTDDYVVPYYSANVNIALDLWERVDVPGDAIWSFNKDGKQFECILTYLSETLAYAAASTAALAIVRAWIAWRWRAGA